MWNAAQHQLVQQLFGCDVIQCYYLKKKKVLFTKRIEFSLKIS